ncbi:MAG: hypothetical protein GY861_18420 [bacterium]|nr:hypothetical protein [bacterium]
MSSIAAQKHELTLLEKQFAFYEGQNAKCHDRTKEIEELDKKLDEIRENIGLAKKLETDAKNAKKSAEKELHVKKVKLDGEIKKSFKELDEITSKVIKKAVENARLSKLLEAVTTELPKKEKKASQISSEIDQLRADRDRTREYYEKECAKSEEEYKEVVDRLEEAKTQRRVIEDEYESLSKIVANLDRKKAGLVQYIQEAEDKIPKSEKNKILKDRLGI